MGRAELADDDVAWRTVCKARARFCEAILGVGLMSHSTTLALRELDGEEAYEAELAECTGVTGYHRWFFLQALSGSLF